MPAATAKLFKLRSLERKVVPSLVRSERGALQDAFEETTSALAKIVKDRLFTSDGYKNMKEYANERWEVSVRHLQRLVACSAVLEALSEFEIKPKCETVCRALKEGASSNRLEIEQIWRQVLEASTHDYDSIGSHSVVAAIEAMIRQDQEAATSRSDRFVGYYMSSAECEYNTPEWLCQLVEQFFDGAVGLDAASNPDSKINARKRFGRQGDGSFVDAFSPANWEIEGAKTCYLNPPGGIIGGNVSVQGTFVNRVVEETKKGNIERSIVLVPVNYRSTWFQQLVTTFAVVFFTESLRFELSEAAKRRRKRDLNRSGDPQSRALFLVERSRVPNSSDGYVNIETTISSSQVGRFIEIFGKHGLVPGENAWCSKETSA